MPLIDIPDYIRQTILIDLALKTTAYENIENENTEPALNQQTNIPLTTIPGTTIAHTLVGHNNNVAPRHLKLKKRNQHYMNSLYLIYSSKGNDRFFKENDNTIETFISENNICTFDNFLSSIKEGSLTKLLQLNFVKNHFTAPDIHGNNALILATFFNFTDIMQYLLEKKSPVGFRNYEGYSAIDIAASLGNSIAVRILIAHGGCEEIEEQDCNALSYAIQKGSTEIIDMIRAKIKQNFDEYENRRRYRVPIRW